MFKPPATHLAQTVRSNLRPAAFGLPHRKWHAAHAKLSGEVCAFGNALLGLRFGGEVGQDFRCLRAADLPQYVGQHVRFRRVQAVFVAGFWAGAQEFQPVLFRRGLLPYQNGSHADRAEGEFVIEYFHIVLRFAQRGGVE